MGVQIVKLLDSAVNINVSVNPTGEYLAEITYQTGDTVSYNGSSYIAISETTGNLPTNTTYWQVIANKGDTGDAATIAVGTVTTGAAGSSATVANSGTSGAAVFDFAIPQGDAGADGLGVPAGGTTGQLLSKVSAADNDTTWTDAPSGTLAGLTDTTITTPADAEVLAYDSASSKWINTTAASGGSTYYTTVVDAAGGGDYTTLGAAVAAASAGDSIFIRSGNYTESAITSALAGLKIIGESRENVVLDHSTNNITFSGTEVEICNVGFTSTTGTILPGGDHFKMHHCNVTHTSSNPGITFNGRYGGVDNLYISYSGTSLGINGNSKFRTYVENCYIDYTASSGSTVVVLNGGYGYVNNNYVLATGISLNGINVSSDCVVSNNYLFGSASGTGSGISASNNCSITGNNIYGFDKAIDPAGRVVSVVGNSINDPKTYGIYLSSDTRCAITGNSIMTAPNGIYLTGSDYNTVTGNSLGTCTTGIYLDSTSDWNVVTGNAFGYSTTYLDISSVNSTVSNNMGVPVTQEIQMARMKNTSGGALAAGDVVTLKAVAAGDEVTTTTTGSDNLVLGMAVEAISNNSYGYIQTLGKTTALKVNGTVAISVGDLLTTYTSAGIAAKATSNEKAFAIALEAYSTADSNGVIDALIITPRQA